jgi:DNA-binding response OmpR family regulator
LSTFNPLMKLLLVEDSERLRKTLTMGLKKAGYAIDATGDGREGLWLAQHNAYDTIILDIMLPGMDGLEVLRNLREQGQPTHVLMLTARDTVEDRVRGLRSGADDYLVKPFAFDELLARVEALCRRSYGHKRPKIKVGCLEVELNSKTVRCEGEVVELAPREYMLIELLAARQGEVISRAEIESHIYDDLADPMSNVVDSAICVLRRKLGGASRMIQTRRGLGYVLQLE